MQRFEGMRPLYYITTNLNAARSVGSNRLWPGGDMGLQLTGYSCTIGIWDESSVLPTHQELSGRVIVADDAAVYSDHATHVAGTLIATGYAAVAHGMAPEADVLSYDWNSDAAEVSAAAADELFLSNHSYSFIAGWQLDLPKPGWNWWGDVTVTTQEDYVFGFYDSTAFAWDQIAYSAPYLLMVAAAGNDRGDSGPAPGAFHWVLENGAWIQSNATRKPDGDYDCLPSGSQVAKNVLVVGAVSDLPHGYRDRSDVILLGFSSWGPTDDGRIKPDIVANGLEVYSSIAAGNDTYNYLSGTSMAAPNVTGSLALLTQHYKDTHSGQAPLGSTLRAIIIHTASASGENSGPDYAYGWGLLNSADAANLILQDSRESRIIQELSLTESDSLVTSIQCDGTSALKVTLAWTDPPGPVPIAQLDPKLPALINDLDLRVAGGDGTTYYPWILDADTPMLSAISGDNTSDNVEQVFLEFPSPGKYSLIVSHKATLATGKQTFSLIASGVSFDPLPKVLVWERDSVSVDHSGIFIRDQLAAMGLVDVKYTNDFPSSFDDYDAAFLSFGPSGSLADRTYFDNQMAATVQSYLETDGRLYLEGGDAMGVDQAANDTLQFLLGIDTTESTSRHPISWLEGQQGTICEGMLFPASTQENNEYPDVYFPGSGLTALVEGDLGSVAIQNAGNHHQRTFVFSYALAKLVDGTSPNTRSNLLRRILDFLLYEPPPPPNSPPKAVDDLAEVYEDSSTTVFPLLNDTDVDGNALRLFSLIDSYHGITMIMEEDTAIGYTPEADYFGPDSFLYVVSDGQGGVDTALVNITVLPVNDMPSAEDDYCEVVEDIPSVIHVLSNDTDIDGDSLAVAVVTQGSHGTCAVNNGARSITYTPDIHFTGQDMFGYVLSDSHGGLDIGTVYIIVLPENDPVIAFADTVSTKEDIPITISVLANDIDWDGDSLRIVQIGVPQHGIAVLETEWTVIYKPAQNYFGSDVFDYVVADIHSALDTAQVFVTITPVNDPPIAIDDTLAVNEDEAGNLAVLVNDREYDGDEIRLATDTWICQHGDIEVSISDSTSPEGIALIYSPGPDFFGTDSFDYVITDGVLLDTGKAFIIIHPVNDAPGSFNLLKPLGDTTSVVITPSNMSDSLVFLWEQAPDVDGDSVYYLFHAGNDTLLHILNLDYIPTTHAVYQYEMLVSRISMFEAPGPICGEWFIVATDGMDTTAAANGPFWLIVDARLLGNVPNNNIPREFALYQNYPNPFNPSTLISFDLPKPSPVRLIIYNLLGEEVADLADEHLPAGRYQVAWNGRLKDGHDAPSGLYIYTLITPDRITYRKMVLLR